MSASSPPDEPVVHTSRHTGCLMWRFDTALICTLTWRRFAERLWDGPQISVSVVIECRAAARRESVNICPSPRCASGPPLAVFLRSEQRPQQVTQAHAHQAGEHGLSLAYPP